MFKLGHTGDIPETFHMQNKHDISYSLCGNKRALCYSCNPDIQFKAICKSCLSNYTNKEIEELKFWLILRKLKK